MGDASGSPEPGPRPVDVNREFSALVSGSRQGQSQFRMRERLGQVLVASLQVNAPISIGLTAAGLGAVWLWTHLAGGAPNPLVHLFYLPIIFAASRFNWRGGLVAGLVAGVAAGPLLPAAAPGAEQLPAAWVVRLIIFVAVGVLVAWLAGESSRPISAFVRDARGARDLRRGLDRGEFVAHYQPIIDLVTGRTTGFETLCRWQHPDRGLVSPADFIPLAERTGAIVPIGTQILEDAARQAATWIEEGAGDLVMAVNVSANQLCQPNFTLVVTGALASSGLSPRRLCLELTETAILHDREVALANLQALHEAGVLIALDDFGTGQSSLAYLQDFPIDIIKIDLSFVCRVDVDRKGAALVSTIIQMARSLGASTVGEGIERQEQLDALRGMGCDEGQGYLLGRPAPPDQVSWSSLAPATSAPAPAERPRLRSGPVHDELVERAAGLLELIDQQSRSGQLELVVGTCEHALALLLRLDDDATTCHVLTRKCAALGALGLCEEALDGLSSARQIADRRQDVTLQYGVLTGLGVVNHALARDAAARQQLTAALALAESLPDETRLSALTHLTGWGISVILDERAAGGTAHADELIPQTLGHATQALALARRLDHADSISTALLDVAVMRWLAGDPAGDVSTIERARLTEVQPAFRASGDRSSERASLRALSDAHRIAGDYRAALRYHHELYELERALRSEQAARRSRLLAGRIERVSARSDAAAEHARDHQRELDTAALHGRALELERHVNQDSLTRLGNRRYLDAVLPELFRTAPSHGRELFVARLDVDHFAAVNTTFGRATGDQVLQRVAEIMSAQSRVEDLLARYEGAAFLLGFLSLDGPSAAARCERLRAAIAAEPWSTLRAGLSITVSIGLAARADADGVADLIDRSRALLDAAEAGVRDQVRAFVVDHGDPQ